MTLEGKAILVVGGAAGIGRAAALECARRGASVIVADIAEDAGRRTAEEAGGLFVRVDATDESSVSAMAERAGRERGRLDALLMTAGILLGAYEPLEGFDAAVFRRVLDVNLTGSFLCAKHCAPWLARAPRGVIVLTSSRAATAGSSSYAYGSSKGGIQSLAITLAGNLEPRGIRVNVLSPGNIDTELKRSVVVADARRRGIGVEQAAAESGLGSPEGVARVLAWLASDDADYVRGTVHTR
jgi:NAD(P)-dependent dehydrogenase (short-subunit alcohol dehydrogenase family)